MIPVPEDISVEDQKSRLKLRIREISLQTYCDKESQFKRNNHALFALLKDGVSKIIRAKLKSKSEFTMLGLLYSKFNIISSNAASNHKTSPFISKLVNSLLLFNFAQIIFDTPSLSRANNACLK